MTVKAQKEEFAWKVLWCGLVTVRVGVRVGVGECVRGRMCQ